MNNRFHIASGIRDQIMNLPQDNFLIRAAYNRIHQRLLYCPQCRLKHHTPVFTTWNRKELIEHIRQHG